MTKKKNSFFTFCFSLIPGAGQMYMGFMKMGLSLMIWFFLIFGVPIMLNLWALTMFSMVVWIYSFFLTHNLRALSDEEFCKIEDRYLTPGGIKIFEMELLKKYRKVVAVVLVFLGITLSWNSLFQMFQWYFTDAVRDFLNQINYALPQLAIGVGIIILGIIMIRGKKKEIFEEEDKRCENIE